MQLYGVKYIVFEDKKIYFRIEMWKNFFCIMIVPGNSHILFEMSSKSGSCTPILSTGNISNPVFCP